MTHDYQNHKLTVTDTLRLVHCISTDIFERRRKYGIPVWMSRHPELNHYICQVSVSFSRDETFE